MGFSLFTEVPLAPKDPILGVTEQFVTDPRPEKVNLGVGVYYDELSNWPLLPSVVRAELALAETRAARGYLPIDGSAAYNKAVQALLLGADSSAVAAGRCITVQSLGGTGALKLAADLIHRFGGERQVYISDPSWENHRALFEAAGFAVHQYPYYCAESRGLDFDAMFASLESISAGSVVVLHACCHNPTGVDLTPAQWERVIEVLARRGLLPILDIAYQGFAEGIDADAAPVRQVVAAGVPVLIANSFSKSFSLYGERIGALTLALRDRDEAQRVLSQLKRVVRTNYSNPPTHGAQLVTQILTTPELRTMWEQELAGMRERIRRMRVALVERLTQAGLKGDFSFVTTQRGMFSYSGLSAEQVARLREEAAIYAIASGRICVAALNDGNVDRVARAFAQVWEPAPG